MRSLCAIGLSLLLTAPVGAAKDRKRHCSLRLHLEANLHDTAAFATAVPAKFSGRKVAIEVTARISEGDVTSFYPYQAPDGSYGALLQLDEHGRMMLEAMSIERRGNLLFVFVNGRQITEFEIDKRISDGKIYIASGLTKDDIELMKKDWRVIGQKKKR